MLNRKSSKPVFKKTVTMEHRKQYKHYIICIAKSKCLGTLSYVSPEDLFQKQSECSLPFCLSVLSLSLSVKNLATNYFFMFSKYVLYFHLQPINVRAVKVFRSSLKTPETVLNLNRTYRKASCHYSYTY